MLSASTGNYYAGQIKVATFVRPNISTSTWPPQLVLRSLCYAARYGSKKTSIQASSGKLLSAPRGLSDVKVRKKPPKQKEMEETQEMAANIQYISGESDVIQEHRFKNWIVIYCSRSTLLFYTYFINDTGFYTFSGFLCVCFLCFLKEGLFSMLPPPHPKHTPWIQLQDCVHFFSPFKLITQTRYNR